MVPSVNIMTRPALSSQANAKANHRSEHDRTNFDYLKARVFNEPVYPIYPRSGVRRWKKRSREEMCEEEGGNRTKCSRTRMRERELMWSCQRDQQKTKNRGKTKKKRGTVSAQQHSPVRSRKQARSRHCSDCCL